MENLIIRLDQEKFTEIIVKDTVAELNICGGNESYIGSFSTKGDVYDLLNTEQIASKKHISVIVGGEESLFPANRIISIENIFKAAKYFFFKLFNGYQLKMEKKRVV